MTTLLLLGDIHEDLVALQRIRHRVERLPGEWAPDLGLATGDFANVVGGLPGRESRSDEAIAEVLSELRRFSCPILFVPGNHDSPQMTGDGGRLLCIDVLGDNPPVEVGGFRFVGLGGSWPLGGFPYEWEDGELLAAQLRAIMGPTDDKPEVLLSHVPPIGCGVGRLLTGEEVGSRVVRQLIRDRGPVLNVCGHVHEGNGWGFLGATCVLNTGAISGVRRWWGDGTAPGSLEEPRYGRCFGSFHLLRLGPRGMPLTGVVGELLVGGWVLRRIKQEVGRVVLSA